MRRKSAWRESLPGQKERSKPLRDNLRRKSRAASCRRPLPLVPPRERPDEASAQGLLRPCCVCARPVFSGGDFCGGGGGGTRGTFRRDGFQVGARCNLCRARF